MELATANSTQKRRMVLHPHDGASIRTLGYERPNRAKRFDDRSVHAPVHNSMHLSMSVVDGHFRFHSIG
jgi:hypothetical protein